jgi:hypothetical protein
MPPPFAHKELTEAQKQTIRRRVEQGAKYETHGPIHNVSRPCVPDVARVANPIDAFIQARLAQDGMKPSPEADRRMLIRFTARCDSIRYGFFMATLLFSC